jgi:hypothetical protein
VAELREDHWWIDDVLNPLQGKTVPCPPEEFVTAWKGDNTLSRLKKEHDALVNPSSGNQAPSLMPAHVDSDKEEGLIKALEEIGVVEIRPNRKINVPDLYRVGALVKRKGGVAPSARGSRVPSSRSS